MLKFRFRDLAAGVSILTLALVAAPHLSHATDAKPVADIVRPAIDLPGPLARRGPARVRIDLETVEIEGQLADGTTYRYWTFNRKVPGPFARVRVGDTVEVVLKNHEDSALMHNVDFHAVTGLHGGGHATKAMPGETKGFTFKALNPGLYVYHCATPSVAQHIASGMYGLILVEPEGGLPKVDREFYVMQGEIYTEEAFGTPGEATLSPDKTLHERPEYVVFNGAVGGLTEGGKPLSAKVGETIRLYFGVGGPNLTSSFHVIGEIFDKVYPMGSATTKVVNDVQTVTVAPGGAVMVDIKLEVPGTYVLVDHALSRVEKGAAGHLIVEGPDDPRIFRESIDRKLAQD
jgi:nitrite reductase (NO-forming)